VYFLYLKGDFSYHELTIHEKGVKGKMAKSPGKTAAFRFGGCEQKKDRPEAAFGKDLRWLLQEL
jgi:hypothetical protein